MSYFDQSTLYISARSPFARRVRIAFLESGIKFNEKVLNVFDHNPELERHNPIQRVPVLVLADGAELVDSSYILQAFYDLNRSSSLMPFNSVQKLICWNLSGIAVGVIEKTVEYFLETLKPQSFQDESVKKECVALIKNGLSFADQKLAEKRNFVGEFLSQADIDWVCAIDYLKLRMPFVLDGPYGSLADLAKRLDERPAFRSTYPPPA